MVPWFDDLFTPINKSTITVHPFRVFKEDDRVMKTDFRRKKEVYNQYSNSEYMKECKRTQTRTCNICGIKKSWIYQGRDRDNKGVYTEDGINKWSGGKCRECTLVLMREYHAKQKQKIKDYYDEKIKALGLTTIDIRKPTTRSENLDKYLARIEKKKLASASPPQKVTPDLPTLFAGMSNEKN